MSALLRLLLVEDNADDAQLLIHEIRRNGYEVEFERVETADVMRAALAEKTWDLIISDYSLPHFNAPQALEVLKASALDLPFIIVSGTIGEEAAVTALKAGAHDFLIKSKYARLAHAIERELKDAEVRREHKRAEDALRASHEQLLSFIEQAPISTAMFDRSMRYLATSRRWVLEYGRGHTDLIGRSHYELHPDISDEWKEAHRRGQAGETLRNDDDLWVREDGTKNWLRWAIVPWKDTKGEQGGIIISAEDITKRKQAEEKIRRQNNYLTALHDIDQAILSAGNMQISLNTLLTRTMSLLAVDAAAVLLFNPTMDRLEFAAGFGFRTRAIETAEIKSGEGYAGKAAMEQKLVQIPNLADEPDDLLLANSLKEEMFLSYFGLPLVVKKKVIGVMEVFHRSVVERDREWLDFFHTLAGQAAIAIDNAQLFDHLQRSNADLEQRVAERTAELDHTNAELKRANRTKNEFLANMSHELRTPLNSILGLSESLLEQRRGSLNDSQQKSLQVIESSGKHLLELINDILDLAKIEAGKLDYYPQAVSVDELSRSSLSFVNSQAVRKSINLNYNNETTVNEITADPRRLKQILVNLLTNAVKFTPDNGQVTLEVRADPEEKLIQFSVIDTGIGITPEDLKRLFNPFVQLDSRLNRKFEGTGLGLALVQKLTDIHGGRIQVESELGKGSRFTIYLRYKQDIAEQPEEMHTNEPQLINKQADGVELQPEGKGYSSPPKILLAEDNEANILTVGEYLESHGYEIIVAHDGLEAIGKAHETSPDIILMDIQMPVMSGLEAMQRLRANSRFESTPIIALTALAMVGDRERCLEAGATEYLSKPVSLKGLRQMIETFLVDMK